jgi:lysozyme family protein
VSFFLPAFQIVVGIEGGYVSNPADPGSETKYGISKRAYPNVDIAGLTLEEAQAIYLRDYWNVCHCDPLPWSRGLCLFDAAVNQGQATAMSMNAQSTSAGDFMARRAVRYAQNREFATFGLGWMRRLFTIMEAAQTTPQSPDSVSAPLKID